MKPQKHIVLVAGKRTPFGSFGGSLKDITATDLAVSCSKAALESIGATGAVVDAAFFGNVCQTQQDAIYLARHIALKSGAGEQVPALTLNRLCGSGFEAIAQAAAAIELGQAEVCLAGGTESMSQAPHIVRGARWGFPLGQAPKMEDSLWSSLTDTMTGMAMANTAEKVGRTWNISRQDCDDLALASQQRYAAALAAGVYDAEIAPVTVQTRKGPVDIKKDEHPKPDTTMEGLQKLKAVFEKDGMVTAGNASGIVDGAAAVLVTTAERAKKEGWPILATFVASAAVGCDPTMMGIGPVPAIRKVLADTGLTLGQIDIFDINEAFAAQYLGVEKELGLDRAKTNIHGGAVALGHPLGASGTRITLHLALELTKRGSGYAIGSACIGGGQGMAILLKK